MNINYLLLAALFFILPLKAQEDASPRITLLQHVYQNAQTGEVRHLNVPYDTHADANLERLRPTGFDVLLAEEVIVLVNPFGEDGPYGYAKLYYREVYDGATHRFSPMALDTEIPTSPALTTSNIHTVFNNFRTGEEGQIVVSGNIADMDAQVNNLTGDALAFYLSNDDRTSRGGVDYGQGSVLGLPFADVEGNIDNIAQAHANDMAATGNFSHDGSDGKGPFDRIQNDPNIGSTASTNGTSCHEFINAAESIYVLMYFGVAPSTDLMLAQAQYVFINETKSAPGHRNAALLQDVHPPGQVGSPQGYTNNHGSTGSEGFVGYATAPGTFFGNNAIYVVHTFFDPIPNTNNECNYQPLGLGAPLPVELLDFSARPEGTDVRLNWTTRWERVSDYFEVQRSSDGVRFTALERIPASGDSDQHTDYTALDRYSVSGLNYYRLRQVDLDGTENFSSVATTILPSNAAPLRVFPNPTTDCFELNGVASVRLYDVVGRRVLEGTGRSFSVAELPPGTYRLITTDEAGRSLFLQNLIIIK